MSSDTILVHAESRTVGAKSELSRLRSEGHIPAVVYNKGEPAEAVQLNEHEFTLTLQRHHGESLMMDMQIGDTAPRHVLLKDVQHHPISNRILHVDFHEVSLDRLVRVHLSLHFTGTPEGVSQGGGTLDVQLRDLEVECKASDMIEEFEVDISHLEIGDSITAGEISLPQAFTLLTHEDVSVVTVLKPRLATAEEEAEEEAAAEAAAEPEVIGESEEEESEEENA